MKKKIALSHLHIYYTDIIIPSHDCFELSSDINKCSWAFIMHQWKPLDPKLGQKDGSWWEAFHSRMLFGVASYAICLELRFFFFIGDTNACINA